MRIQLSLSRTVMLGIKEYRNLLYGDAPVQNGFIVGLSYKNLLPNLKEINWVKVNLYEKEFLKKFGDESMQRTKTTINIETDVLQGIQDLRSTLVDENIFGTSRIYVPFVVKLLILGAILHNDGKLPIIKEDQ